MRKVLLSALLAGVLLTSIPLPAVTANTEERGFISVSANANKEIAADVAEISIEIQTYDSKSMQNATLENKIISDKVYSAMKLMINPVNGDFVKTANFSASPQYNYSGSKKTFDKYQVSNSIIVRTKNINDVGSIIDKALSLGATNINNLSFTISNYDAQCSDLLTKATQKAKSQAEIIARSVSSSVSGIKSVSGSCSNTNNSARVHYNLLESKAAGATSSDMITTPIESGTVKIYANINAEFYVK